MGKDKTVKDSYRLSVYYRNDDISWIFRKLSKETIEGAYDWFLSPDQGDVFDLKYENGRVALVRKDIICMSLKEQKQ